MRKYTPKPVDTRSVILDPSLLDLVEYLARNTHEVWGAGRIGQGWSHGPARDDVARTHPCLVPYEQLSEAEKDLDRGTAMETLKLITAYGYKIQSPETQARGSLQLPTTDEVSKYDLPQLVQRWKEMGADLCHGSADVYLTLGQRANEHGEYLLAYDIFKEGLRFHPGHILLSRFQAAAMQRSGAPHASAKALAALIDGGNVDEETVGLLASSYKDLWSQSIDPDEARGWLTIACDTYERAFKLDAGYWPAINLATLSAFLGQPERSEKYAIHARDQCLRQLEFAAEADRYWKLATIGEAYLLLRDHEKAEQYYLLAAKASGGSLERIRSTRAQACRILSMLGVSGAECRGMLQRCLDLPRVVVFSGHQIDTPDRPEPRFSPKVEGAVAEEIENALRKLNCGFGYSSAACGGDILFLEAVLKRKAEANIILPYSAEQFLHQSVAVHGGNWADRFRKLMATPGVRITVTSAGPMDEGISYDYSNRFTFGLAGLRADRWGAELATLTVWDGKKGNGPGGTYDAVTHWRKSHCEPTIINPQSLLPRFNELADSGQPGESGPGNAPRRPGLSAGAASGFSSALDRDIQPRVAALVFTDIVEYSSLAESEIPLIIQHVLRRVTQIASDKGRVPLHISTWGDSFYVVFESIAEAGEYALDLQDLMVQTEWLKLGFCRNLAVRTALHFGPVYSYTNPTSRLTDFIGTHVSRAARMEPITPPNHVYASEAFAAISFAERINEFCCEYVGKLGLAKNYGTYPAYHVRRIGTRRALKPG